MVPMLKLSCAATAGCIAVFAAGPASAHDAGQVHYELQARGYYNIRFLVPEPPFQVNACRDGVRFHLHVDYYGRIRERADIGPCHNWSRAPYDDGYGWRRRYYGDYGYRRY
jgi:hypothetical protein